MKKNLSRLTKNIFENISSNQLLTISIYLAVVLIWGGSFIAIEFQLGYVDETVSVLYRYAASSFLITIYAFISRKPMFSFSLKTHFQFVLVGLFFFSANYVFIYKAQTYLTSGAAAITFTMCLFFTQINARIFLKTSIGFRTAIGGIIGVVGISLIFRDAIFSIRMDMETLKGVSLILGAAYIVSLATVVTARITLLRVPVFQANAWAMIYGTIFNVLFVLLFRDTLTFDPRASYWISLTYLVFFGSISGFLLYFLLVKRIGPERSSYFALMAPMVAIFISVFVENLQITFPLIIGAGAILLGNLITLRNSQEGQTK